MANVRLIARLDIKGPHLIKGVHLEGLRKMGDPNAFAQRYYENAADELIYMDVVASLYGRNNLTAVVEATTKEVFVPLTVGGGVRSVADAETLLRAGADKVAINTAAVARPDLIDEISRRYGSQCLVLSVEAKRVAPDRWEAYTDNGRERSGRDVLAWTREAVERGAGEILLTSIDQEGTRKGFDIALTRSVATSVRVPVIASGGMGGAEDLLEVVRDGRADAVAMADVLHYNRMEFSAIRAAASAGGVEVRQI